MRPDGADLFAGPCPWESAPDDRPALARAAARAINDAAFTIRRGAVVLGDASTSLTPDELDALREGMDRYAVRDLGNLLLEFADAFGRAMGASLGVMSFEEFAAEMKKVDAVVQELEEDVDKKSEEYASARRLWQAQVAELRAERDAAQQEAQALGERVEQLERSLVYAAAQVGARR